MFSLTPLPFFSFCHEGRWFFFFFLLLLLRVKARKHTNSAKSIPSPPPPFCFQLVSIYLSFSRRMRFSSGPSVRVFVISLDVFGLKDFVQGRGKRKSVDDDGRGKFAFPEDITCNVGNVMGKDRSGIESIETICYCAVMLGYITDLSPPLPAFVKNVRLF
jgi:hypothetical protein